jgi:hypothetical protein
MLSTRTAADLHAFLRLTRKQPLFRVLDDDHKVAVGAALQSLNTGIFEFLALDDSRVCVVKLDGKGFAEVSVVELGVTTIGVRTNDILIRNWISVRSRDNDWTLTAVCAPTATSVIFRIHSRQKLCPSAH